ncbi:MAG: hypothetical protein ACRDQ5_18170 [Sciscionella sp.]
MDLALPRQLFMAACHRGMLIGVGAMPQPQSGQGGWLSDLAFWINDGPRATVGSAGSVGQGFSLSRDEATSLLTQAENVLDDLKPLINKADQLRQMQPPADDPASNGYNHIAAGGGRDTGVFGFGVGHVEREYNYLRELVRRLRDALGSTQDTDEHAGRDIAGTGNDGGVFG